MARLTAISARHRMLAWDQAKLRPWSRVAGATRTRRRPWKALALRAPDRGHRLRPSRAEDRPGGNPLPDKLPAARRTAQIRQHGRQTRCRTAQLPKSRDLGLEPVQRRKCIRYSCSSACGCREPRRIPDLVLHRSQGRRVGNLAARSLQARTLSVSIILRLAWRSACSAGLPCPAYQTKPKTPRSWSCACEVSIHEFDCLTCGFVGGCSSGRAPWWSCPGHLQYVHPDPACGGPDSAEAAWKRG